MPEQSTTQNPADSTHNHPPRCCCSDAPDADRMAYAELDTCPRCPWHGDEAAAGECPSCHTPYGRPHTDYCQAVAPADYPGQPDHCTYPRSDHGDGRGCQDDNCPRHGGRDDEPDQMYSRWISYEDNH